MSIKLASYLDLFPTVSTSWWLILLLFVQGTFSPILAQSRKAVWAVDIADAKRRALEENHFIVIDFWATWCAPCRAMDAQVWNSFDWGADQSFVLLRVDVDLEQVLPLRYKVESLPKVIVIDFEGTVIASKEGFSDRLEFVDFLQNIPNSTDSVNGLLNELRANERPAVTLEKLGHEYRILALKANKAPFRSSFLRLSSKYFTQAIDLASEEKRKELDLWVLFNSIYDKGGDKVLTKLRKQESLYQGTRHHNLMLLVLIVALQEANRHSEAQELATQLENSVGAEEVMRLLSSVPKH